MTQPFILKVTDNVETLDFLSSSISVVDGGFDIGLPRAKRSLGLVRPGFYAPVSSFYEFREAKIKFSLWGDTRADILNSLHKIERVLRNLSSRYRISTGKRGELSYAWEGSTNITYFEVYGGDVLFPSDILSVSKIHAEINNRLILPECELILQLSPVGYGLSIYSEATTEIPLYNPSIGSKQTGGVTIKNPKALPSAQYNYVEIDGADLPGSQPHITKITLGTGADYSAWYAMYMGVQHTPFPTKTIFDIDDKAWGIIGGNTVVDSAAEGGSYLSTTLNGQFNHNFFSTWAWSVTNTTIGRFFGFFHGGTSFPGGTAFAIGVDDYVTFGIRFQEDYVAPISSASTVGLGSLQLPPTDIALGDYGTINPDLWLGVWFMYNGGSTTLTMDSLSLMPIANGMRILRSRVSKVTAGTYVDDGWRGIEYFKDGTNKVSTPVYGILEPLKLEPAITQRIYFTSIGVSAAIATEKVRSFSVRLYTVPTYLTMAL